MARSSTAFVARPTSFGHIDEWHVVFAGPRTAGTTDSIDGREQATNCDSYILDDLIYVPFAFHAEGSSRLPFVRSADLHEAS